MATALESAWAAGFVDGEGYIGITRKYARNRYRKDKELFRGKPRVFVRKCHYQLSVQVTQRNRMALDQLALLFGGTVRPHGIGKRETQYWAWAAKSGVSLAFVTALFPYLTNKKHVASVALEFATWYAATRDEKGFGRSMTDARRQRAEEYCLEVQRINRLYRDVPEQSVVRKIATSVEVAS